MCTAIRYNKLLGRNFDYDTEYEQSILIIPRNYPLKLRHRRGLSHHYAFMGTGFCADDFPLCYDAVNEKGLAIAALNFPHYAKYRHPLPSRDNIASFEVIPYILSKCSSVTEATSLIKDINITGTAVSKSLPPSPLHWMIADRDNSLVLEATEQGLKLHKNRTEVLTNSPPFDVQMFNLSNYMRLSKDPPKNHFSRALKLSPYSVGMGAMGLPGDSSSMSRFVRSCFKLHNSPLFESKEEGISHLFRLLYCASMTKGEVITERGISEYTQYSCCIDLCEGEYRYISYNSLSPKSFSLKDQELNAKEYIKTPLI